MFNKKLHQFYQFKSYIIKDDKVITWNLEKFVLNQWSIEGIELPKRNLTNIKIYHQKSNIEDSWRIFYGILRNYFNSTFPISNNYYLKSILIKKNFLTEDEIKKLTWKELMNKWINNYIKLKIDKKYLLNFDYQFNAKLNLANKKVSLNDSNTPGYFYEIVDRSDEPTLNFVYDQLIMQVNLKSDFYFHVEK